MVGKDMPLTPFHMVERRHLGSFIDPDNMRFPFVFCCFQYLHFLSPTCHIGVKSTLQYQKTFYYFQAFQSPPNTIIWQLSISILSEIPIKAVTKKLHFDCLLFCNESFKLGENMKNKRTQLFPHLLGLFRQV